jgi:HD-GYP domain-containing protein (c-di-GMP phosphodiesterase class II)
MVEKKPPDAFWLGFREALQGFEARVREVYDQTRSPGDPPRRPPHPQAPDPGPPPDWFFAGLQAFSALLEGRDAFTYGHSRRVAHTAVAFVTHLGWSLDEVKKMNAAALLHDIGKVIIPDCILLKEGRFTSLEFETMKLHSSTGSRIIGYFPGLPPEVEPWVLHHHERFDGEGYPDGLAGAEIPVGARILALADAFDAMTTHRRYKAAFPHWVALDEIGKCAGRQFDPDLANEFMLAFPDPPWHPPL